MPAHLSGCIGMLINPKVSPPSVAVSPPIRAGEKSLHKGVCVCVCIPRFRTQLTDVGVLQ